MSTTDAPSPLAGRRDGIETARDAADAYRARCERFGAERDGLTRRWNLVANLRLVAFVLGAVAVGWGGWRQRPELVAVGVALLVGFVALAVYHGRLGRQRRRAATLWAINDEAIKRVGRDWDGLPVRHTARIPVDHPFAADLDLFGRASLMHLLDTTSTPMGEATLADWLLTPAAPAVVKERQAVVAALAPRLDLRQELELRGRLAAGEREDPEPFLAWAEGRPWLAKRPWLGAVAWIGPVVLVALVVAQIVGLVDRPYWLLALVANLAIGQTVGRAAYGIIAGVAAHHRALLGYAGQLELLATAGVAWPPERERAGGGPNPTTANVGGETGTGIGATTPLADGRSAPALLRRLGRLAALPIPPSSPLYLAVQGLVLWDVHVLAAMERWQRVAGGRARGWLALLGEAEALSALAGLAHDNPGWAFPVLDRAADTVEARELGHPLLAAAVRVVNDVAVGPPGTFLLVTGSNMSGKSTLLRGIGVNAVLAGTGGPVCAAALQLPPVALWTSVRVQDSLERGVSFFMAELQRLKLVVDAARQERASGGPPVLYLLDEILQGTNTAERQIAARRIIAELVAQGAIGAVSTHDLALADAPELAGAARAVHFTDTVGDGVAGPVMSFDYRLRPGVATTTNALRLMQLVGLDLGPPATGGAVSDAIAAPAAPGVQNPGLTERKPAEAG